MEGMRLILGVVKHMSCKTLIQIINLLVSLKFFTQILNLIQILIFSLYFIN